MNDLSSEDIKTTIEDSFPLKDFNKYHLERRYYVFKRISGSRVLTCGGLDLLDKKVNAISCDIVFIEYEKLLHNTHDIDNLMNFSSIYPSRFQKVVDYNFHEQFKKYFPIHFDQVDKVKEYLRILTEFYDSEAKPFFNYWKDIRSFLPFIETSDISEYTKVLGTNSIIKKMIIWRLCDHPGFDDFTKERIAILESALKENPENESYNKVLIEIKEKYSTLKSIPPKYKWDPDYLVKKDFSEYLSNPK